MTLFLGIFLLLTAVVGLLFKWPTEIAPFKKGVSGALSAVGVISIASGGFSYNDSGYCQHIRTIFGTEGSKCTTGWYFEGWGQSTAYPHLITVAHTQSSESGGSSVSGPYRVRLADNWSGDVSQTTRFAIPKDEEQFLTMARAFRSPERLISTTLKPSITASLDSVANMFTMEEYYAGGKRDQFKSEYSDAVIKGRVKVRQVNQEFEEGVVPNKVAPNDSKVAQDTSNVGETQVRKLITEKVLDEEGNEIRVSHDYVPYGIVVASAILENLDPDDRFEGQIQARKDAASRRIVAREQRLEQEEQRLLAIQAGETNIAKRQAAAKEEQIQKTTDAETSKKLTLIEAERLFEQAEIEKKTALEQLARDRTKAKSIRVLADAEAYQKKAIIEADNALQQKLDAYVQAQTVWAEAYAKRRVPQTVFGAAQGDVGSNTDASNFMNLMTIKAAQDLNLDTSIKKTK